MKCNKLITSALLALGLVSSASAASSVTLNGTNYTVVYITGSTAFRSYVFTAVTAPTTFDSGAYVTQPASGVTGSTSTYNIYGTIGGTPTLLSFDWTGSEAGLAALTGLSVGISNPNTASTLTNYLSSGVVLPGTPNATAYVNPAGGAAVTAVADLAFADTSQAVSLSAAKPALVDYGIVGVVPFTWAKGKLTGAQSSSYTNLVNVSTPQLKYLAGSGVEVASYFTGQAGDTNDIYLIGRNKGSGTRVNMVLDTQKGTSASASVDQWVPADSFYATGTQNALTFGTVQALTAAGGLVEVLNDGYDSGSGVVKTLADDLNGSTDANGQVITIGYAGIGDWQGAGAGLAGGAVALTENGVAESDGAIETGTYSFWGHEHLYGPHGQSTSSAGGVVALFLTGGTYNESLGTASTAAGAIEASFGSTGGGREANPFSHAAATGTASTGIDPAVVHANKPSDAGYPSQSN